MQTSSGLAKRGKFNGSGGAMPSRVLAQFLNRRVILRVLDDTPQASAATVANGAGDAIFSEDTNMTNKTFGRTTWKKFGTLSVLGLAALSLMPQSARADNDDDNAPVYSQSRDNDSNYDNDGARLAQLNNQRLTIRGTVQSNERGNVFTLRIDNSRTVTVYSRSEPPRLSRGDQVEASGFIDRRNNRFTADSVRVVRDNDNNNGSNQTVRGTVIDERRGQNAFVMRASDGRAYLVDTRRTNQQNIQRGQTVEVRGRLQGSSLLADNVRIIGTDNNGNYNTLTRGVVTDTGRGPDAFLIRADNGQTYLVGTRNSNRMTVQQGQTVEVRGRVLGDSIYASSVRLIDGGSNGNNVLTGRVTRDYYGRDFELRTENGRSVTVRARREPIRLSRGDLVEVRGEMNNGIFQADSVRVLRDNDNGNDGNRDRVNFTATVQRGGSGDFTVRADNGRDYTVQNSNVSVGYGDRVRVVGNLSRGVITAARVTVTDRNNGNNGNNNNQGDFMRFDGRVRQVGTDFLVVRDESKDQDRQVRTNNARAFNVGDRVRVEGYHRNGQVNATSISRR